MGPGKKKNSPGVARDDPVRHRALVARTQGDRYTGGAASVPVVSDGLHCFNSHYNINGEVVSHAAITVGSGRQAMIHPEFLRVNTNTVLPNLKTAISGLTMRSNSTSMLAEVGD